MKEILNKENFLKEIYFTCEENF